MLLNINKYFLLLVKYYLSILINQYFTTIFQVFVQDVNPILGKLEWKVETANYEYVQEIARSSYGDMLHDDERVRELCCMMTVKSTRIMSFISLYTHDIQDTPTTLTDATMQLRWPRRLHQTCSVGKHMIASAMYQVYQ